MDNQQLYEHYKKHEMDLFHLRKKVADKGKTENENYRSLSATYEYMREQRMKYELLYRNELARNV